MEPNTNDQRFYAELIRQQEQTNKLLCELIDMLNKRDTQKPVARRLKTVSKG